MPRRIGVIAGITGTALAVLTGVSQAAPITNSLSMSVPTSSVGMLIRYVGSQPAQYSGIYLDPSTNQWVVAVPDGTDMGTALNAAAARFPLASTTAPHMTVTVTHEKRSLAQLRQIESQVQQRVGTFGSLAGDQITEWGLNEQTNTVQIGVVHLTDQLVAAARATYGDGVHLIQAPRTQAADWHEVMTNPTVITKSGSSGLHPNIGGGGTRLSETLPLAAGDRLLTATPVPGQSGTFNVTQCTSGWNTPIFMFTAGHCFTQGTMVDQGFVDTATNTFTVNGPVGPVNTVQFGNNRMDWESMNTQGFASLANEVYTGGVTSSTGIAQESLLSAGLNEPICTDGSFTGESCNGTVDMTEGCVDLDDNGTEVLVCDQDFAVSSGARLVQHGDSGGPVFAHDNGFVSPGVGVISGGNVGTTTAPGPGDEVNFTDGGSICNLSGECVG